MIISAPKLAGKPFLVGAGSLKELPPASQQSNLEHRNVACARDDVIDKAKELIETNLCNSTHLLEHLK